MNIFCILFSCKKIEWWWLTVLWWLLDLGWHNSSSEMRWLRWLMAHGDDRVAHEYWIWSDSRMLEMVLEILWLILHVLAHGVQWLKRCMQWFKRRSSTVGPRRSKPGFKSSKWREERTKNWLLSIRFPKMKYMFENVYKCIYMKENTLFTANKFLVFEIQTEETICFENDFSFRPPAVWW